MGKRQCLEMSVEMRALLGLTWSPLSSAGGGGRSRGRGLWHPWAAAGTLF